LIDHDFLTPTQSALFQRYKFLNPGVSWSDWLLQQKILDLKLFLALGFILQPLGYCSKRRIKGWTSDKSLGFEEAVNHIKGSDATRGKSGNYAIEGSERFVLVESDRTELSPAQEKLLSLTLSWATPKGWVWVCREPFDNVLDSKLPDGLFDKRQMGTAYVLAPWSLSCPDDNAEHLNTHYCTRICKCQNLDSEGKHYFRKEKSPVCTCDGKTNRHFCNFSNTTCPKPRFRLWFNRKPTIISFRRFAQITLGEIS